MILLKLTDCECDTEEVAQRGESDEDGQDLGTGRWSEDILEKSGGDGNLRGKELLFGHGSKLFLVSEAHV